MLARYRATGADLPFGDPRRPHGVAFEGWFWRVTDPDAGRVAIVLLGVNRDAAGGSWGTVALASHPGGHVAQAAVAHAWADGGRCGAGTPGHGPWLEGGPDGVRVDLGPGARLEARFAVGAPWPRSAFGGIGPAQCVPGLSQYWHPHVLGARVTGDLELGGEAVRFDGARGYAEKNWGSGGFPPSWWWGQAQGFARDDLCVAFAGGLAGLGPVHVTATSLVVRAGARVLRTVRPFDPVRITVDDRGWRFAARLPRWRVEVEAHAAGTAPHLLPVPLPAERRNLDGAARQHLAGELRLAVRGRGLDLEEVSPLAGLERGRGRPAPSPAPPAAPPA